MRSLETARRTVLTI